jgi:hypothetical protein
VKHLVRTHDYPDVGAIRAMIGAEKDQVERPERIANDTLQFDR